MLKDTGQLHPEIWTSDKKMDDEVRQTLLDIATDFLEGLEMDEEIVISDIILTGSMTTPNYTQYSDIDLHIVLPFDQFEMDEEILRKLFQKAKNDWNTKHDIQIFGHDVEIYIQDEEEKHTSVGMYSLFTEWIKFPSDGDLSQVDTYLLKKKTKDIMRLIKRLERYYLTGKDIGAAAEKLKQFLIDMRKEGLSSLQKTRSIENLVFKVLRSLGYLTKLEMMIRKTYDKEMSIN